MTRARDVGVDALRGVALVSMFVAHTAPVTRFSAFDDLSEYLTYPLFADLVGMGAALGRGRRSDPAVRGLLIERLDTSVNIILVYLSDS